MAHASHRTSTAFLCMIAWLLVNSSVIEKGTSQAAEEWHFVIVESIDCYLSSVGTKSGGVILT